jgi:DNA-binding transcriptional LysR family regulator
MEMGTLEGVVGFVEAGIGIAAMPESFIRPISKGKKVVMLSLPNEVATLQTYVVFWQHTASPLVNDFFDHCREIRDR